MAYFDCPELMNFSKIDRKIEEAITVCASISVDILVGARERNNLKKQRVESFFVWLLPFNEIYS